MKHKTHYSTSVAQAFGAALRLLQRMAQTEMLLRQKLGRRQFEPAVIDAVIIKLKSMKFIDDQKYAHDYVAYRSRTSPLGKYHLKAKLMQKGIDKDIAKNAADEISADEELRLAGELAAKRLNALSRFEPTQQKLKLARFLAARGFSSQTVYTIIQEI